MQSFHPGTVLSWIGWDAVLFCDNGFYQVLFQSGTDVPYNWFTSQVKLIEPKAQPTDDHLSHMTTFLTSEKNTKIKIKPHPIIVWLPAHERSVLPLKLQTSIQFPFHGYPLVCCWLFKLLKKIREKDLKNKKPLSYNWTHSQLQFDPMQHWKQNTQNST